MSQTSNHDASEPDPRGPQRTQVRVETMTADHLGRRLDNVLLGLLKGAPKGLIYKLVRSGQVRVNGRRAKPDYRVVLGDQLRIPPVADNQSSEVRISDERMAQLDAAILYEDERMLVLNKPSGLACHAGSGLRYGVIEIMRALRPQLTRLDLGHRLDRETSGCLVLAKDLPTLRIFHSALRERDTAKHYVALLQGQLTAELSRIDVPLESSHKRPGERRTTVAVAGKVAGTVIETQQRCGPHTLVNMRLETGRMHQIRAHARHIGHPVAGDRDYGDKLFNAEMKGFGLKRLFLHATRIACHVEGLELDVSAPLPHALADVAEALRRT